MHSADDIMTRIIELDARAESARTKAAAESERIKAETDRLIEEEKKEFERRTKEKIDAVNKAARKKREEEEAKVRTEFENIARSVEQKSGQNLARFVDAIVARVKGTVV